MSEWIRAFIKLLTSQKRDTDIMGLLMEEHCLPKNSNLKIKASPCLGLISNLDVMKHNLFCSTFTSYLYIQLFHIRSLNDCIVSLFLLLSSYSLISTQQLNDILECKPEHVTSLLKICQWLPINPESNQRSLPWPPRSHKIWSKFITY